MKLLSGSINITDLREMIEKSLNIKALAQYLGNYSTLQQNKKMH